MYSERRDELHIERGAQDDQSLEEGVLPRICSGGGRRLAFGGRVTAVGNLVKRKTLKKDTHINIGSLHKI